VVRPASGRFGAYEILHEIRHGGMGVVYQARDTRLNRLVALKTMRADALGQTSEMVERFRREAQAIAQLEHRHIVPIYDFSEQDGQHYFAMAFAAGGSLSQNLGRYSADPRDAAGLVQKVAGAVQYAHEKGILHRDLKPANVLLDEEGEPLVSDFGLAKFVYADADLTQTGAVLGTPSYMAPEQAIGQGERIGPATDVWALGVILYELLTGRKPFVGSNSDEVRLQVREADPPRPTTARPGLDRSLETIVLKCLDKEPARRYGSAKALADDLARWLQGEPITARPEGWLGRVRRTVRRRPRLATALLLAVAITVAAAAAVTLRDADRPVNETLPPDAYRALQELRQRLDRGEAVTLVGETGPPQWWQWAFGGGAVSPQAPDQPFQISAHDLALLELFPAPLPERFVFRAEIKLSPPPLRERAPQSAEPDPGGGLYSGYSKHATTRGGEHCFCTLLLTAADRADSAIKEFALRPQRIRERGAPGHGWHTGTTGVGKRFSTVGPDRAETWQAIAVKVTPQTIEALRDGQSLGTWRRDDPLLNARIMFGEDNPELDPAVLFGPRGGLGLCVQRGGAEFRRVVVEPIK
jgi:serine/threonine-protein kinase